MYKFMQAIVFAIALMMITAGTAFGQHWKASVNHYVELCFQETEKVTTGADPATLSTLPCTRALRSELSRTNQSATLYNRGIVQRAQGYLVAAQKSFEKAVQLSGKVDQRNLALAEVARELGDFQIAFEQYGLLNESEFITESAGLQAAVFARLNEAGTAYMASVSDGQACAGCHGGDGISARPQVPTLAGRSEDYLAHALYQYRNGERDNAVMAFQAALIPAEDVSALARYYGSLDTK